MNPDLQLSKRSIQRKEEDLYSFLWKGSVVFVKYNRESKAAFIITYYPTEIKEEIYDFINTQFNDWVEEQETYKEDVTTQHTPT